MQGRRSRPKLTDPIEIKIDLRAKSAEQAKKIVLKPDTEKLEKVREVNKKKRLKPLKNKILLDRKLRKLRSQSLPRCQEQDIILKDVSST
ncbi:hypothetical protein Ciccas_004311 [Cichlidogyrus casuarinus]|uniref:Uncharacterized protein n=1 Tax=Cichlidogyrus casuarinus TaxID=1844966 RepID=A0ABD2QBV2_9PLAT